MLFDVLNRELVYHYKTETTFYSLSNSLMFQNFSDHKDPDNVIFKMPETHLSRFAWKMICLFIIQCIQYLCHNYFTVFLGDACYRCTVCLLALCSVSSLNITWQSVVSCRCLQGTGVSAVTPCSTLWSVSIKSNIKRWWTCCLTWRHYNHKSLINR